MKAFYQHIFGINLLLVFLSGMWMENPLIPSSPGKYYTVVDTIVPDTGKVKLPYPFKDRRTDKISGTYDESPFYLKDPSNIKSSTEFDPAAKGYNIEESIGKDFYRNPTYLTMDEYLKNEYRKSTNNYWKKKNNDDNNLVLRKPLVPKLHIGGEVFDRIFGGNTVDIRPNGSAELTFGWVTNTNENPTIPEGQRTTSNFDFRERIQLNVVAAIGDKLKLTTNYNTEATFDFENQMKLEYTGYEDEIIKKIEAGNVSLPLNSSLITGSQSLFGVKTQLQFGRLTVTSIFSQQKGKTSTVEVTGGAQINTFSITADNYEANRHYFLNQYFVDNYDNSLAALPIVKSRVNINRIEVWVTNRNIVTENTRNIIAFKDLAEKRPENQSAIVVGDPVFVSTDSFPSNESNKLYGNFSSISGYRNLNTPITDPNLALGKDYEKVENAKRLSPNEYTFNSRLGYISLNQSLNNDEVLAVAYEYTIGNKVYKVGELSTSGVQGALYLKMLKSTTVNTTSKIWDLMMKNIYSINAYQVTNKDFRLDVMYLDNSIGSTINYIPESAIKGVPLIKLLNLDQLNQQNMRQSDGLFDYVEGTTINSSNGRIIFPVREPFGTYLEKKIADPLISKKYAYHALYRQTQNSAKQQLEFNKFSLKGTYQSSSSSEISLNATNIPQGSVVVTAGGNKLIEGTDYQVDYTLGRVKITNEGVLQSGAPIKVSTESNSMFSVQTKTLMGSRFDYMVSKELTLGGTILNLKERPITQKVNIGEEPISNTIWGIDGTYSTNSRFITKIVDKIPFIDTKENSTFTVSAEYAQLIPGHANAIGKEGTAYIDDFEGSKSPIDLRSYYSWYLSSVPQGQPQQFPENAVTNNIASGYNRAKLAWYNAASLLTGDEVPDHISKEQQSDHYVREVLEKEIFPNKEVADNASPTTPVLNLAFYPEERGPYNYNVKGLTASGKFADPKSKWAGIIRKVETTDFEASNIEFIEFWLMDPFVKPGSSNGGDLYFNLGNVSEDILRDGLKSFENGIPTSSNDANLVINNIWGRIPNVQEVVKAFDSDPDKRRQQDVGLDGYSNDSERDFKRAYIDSIGNLFGTASRAYQQANDDPSADDFHSYKGDDYDAVGLGILDRFKKYNGMEGNSPTSSSNGGPTAASPDNEDINRNNTLDLSENYYQYRVELKPGRMQVGQNYITSKITSIAPLANGGSASVDWYQFKIPIRKPEQIVGSIEDFQSIRFLRMYFKGFEDSMICRFGRLQFVRGEWRKFNSDLLQPGFYPGDNDNFDNTAFDLSTVSFEEDGSREGIPYVLPPDIEQQTSSTTGNLQKLNEQSLLLRVCNLKDGDARAGFKNTNLDMRSYKKMKMFIHLERGSRDEQLNTGDVTCFVRLGSDFTDNYYEIEVPLTPSAPGSSGEYAVWPEKNWLEVSLGRLQELKALRTKARADLVTEFPKDNSFRDGNSIIRIKGVPNLSNVRTIMIGVRNPKQINSTDDGLAKCAEVWVNELRMTDFDEEGGWAANARIVTKMADFGTLSLSGSRSTPGFGSIEQKINERKKEEITQYDASSSLELGKFLPEKTGISVPMYVGYARGISIPQYNPLDPDVKLKPFLETLDKDARDSVEELTTDLTIRRSINFTNVKKNRVGNSKQQFYDIENWNFTYAYTDMHHRNVNIEYNDAHTHRAAIGYNYQINPKNIAPFSKIKVKNKYAKPFTEINFYYAPSSISFRTDLDRQFAKSKLRNVSSGGDSIEPTYNKLFNTNRYYDVKYDPMKSVKIDFSAVNNSVVDEPPGEIDTKAERDIIWKNVFPGRTVKYHHKIGINWATPINKFPITDWINLTIRYEVDYDWAIGTYIDDNYKNDNSNIFGNTIQNSTSTQFNAPLNMTMLYNKIPYFRKLNQKRPAPPKKESNLKLPADTSKTKKDKKNNNLTVFDYMAKVLISLKSIKLNYTITDGTLLPGYLPKTSILGQDYRKGAFSYAPGPAFILGRQYDEDDTENNIRYWARDRGWLKKAADLNNPYVQTHVENYSIQGNMEPLPSLRIDLNANKNHSINHQEFFRWNGTTWVTESPQQTGNLSYSFLTISTAFKEDNEDNISEVFQTFLDARGPIAGRLNDRGPSLAGLDSNGFPNGYSHISQQVLIPAFMAAYSGQNSNNVNLNAFKVYPRPNWRITYDGFSKMAFIKKLMSSFVITHSYRSSFNVNSFVKNFSNSTDSAGNIVPDRLANGDWKGEYDIQQVSISETFGPLIGFDMAFKNNITTRFDVKKDRMVSLSFANNQITEVKGTDYTVGLGYRLKQFKIPFKINKKQIKLENDVDFKFDFTWRKSFTVIRRIIEKINQPSAGTNSITLGFTIDYIINERFNIQAFYKRAFFIPLVSASYANSQTNAGISIRFTLSQ